MFFLVTGYRYLVSQGIFRVLIMLYIVATPIGNLEDITLRALRILKEADIILAEDTRKTGRLLKHFHIKKPLVSFYEHNERGKIPWVLEKLKAGRRVALVSNAGTPTVSDPGYKLIRACRQEGLSLTSVPGPSSIINAVVLTSLPHESFFFLGYLARKKSRRKAALEKIKQVPVTVVFFESPHRLCATLEDIKEVLGNKRVAVAREMTKKFEEVHEGSLEEVRDYFTEHLPRGEVTILIDKTRELT